VLLCGRKFIDEGHSSSDEIKARCDQLQENWDELKNLAEQRCACIEIYRVLGPVAACHTHFTVALVEVSCSGC